jgi:hypothetical protein
LLSIFHLLALPRVVQSTLLKAGGRHPSASSSAIPAHPAQWRAQLHRASIVYEFEQYRQKTAEYRAKYGWQFGCRTQDGRFIDCRRLCAFDWLQIASSSSA